MSERRLPDGYQRRSGGAAAAFAWHAAVPWVDEWLRAAEAEADTLYAWATQRDLAGTALPPLEGRGPVRVVKAPAKGPEGRGHWAVRHYHRGGRVAAPLLGDRYSALGASRPEIELAASAVARARGIRTPAVVAGATYPSAGGLFYRADLVTEWVPGMRTLSQALLEAIREVGASEVTARLLREAGRLVRALEHAGVHHVDLAARNLLVASDGGPPWVVDLDRCRIGARDDGAIGSSMLARLERSLRKLEASGGRAFTAADSTILRAGYAERP